MYVVFVIVLHVQQGLPSNYVLKCNQVMNSVALLSFKMTGSETSDWSVINN